MKNQNISATIVAQPPSNKQFKGRSPQKSPQAEQLSLFTPANPQDSADLRIEPVPEALQWHPEPRYWLVHQESGLRVPGTWSLEEAQIILYLSEGWDWVVDPPSRIPACQGQILALCEAVCDREIQRQGKSHKVYRDLFTSQLAGGEV